MKETFIPQINIQAHPSQCKTIIKKLFFAENNFKQIIIYYQEIILC